MDVGRWAAPRRPHCIGGALITEPARQRAQIDRIVAPHARD